MASLTITQTSPVVNTVAVTQTVSPVTLEITEQVTQHTVVVSPQNITNYYGGGNEVLASLTGVASLSTNLGTFTEDVIADNETIKGALQDLEDGVVNNEAAISTNATDIATNTTDITGVSTVANANFTSITAVQGDLATEVTNRTNADTALQNQITSNDGDIATNVTDISTNTSAIATNATDISTNAGEIATNATNIGSNLTAIQSNDADISSNASNISTNASNIGTNSNNIAQLQTDLSAEETDRIAADNALTSGLNANTGAISANTAKLANIENNAKDDQNAAEVPVAATPSNYTAGTSDVEAHLAGIDTALANAGGADATLQSPLDPTETQLFFTDPGTFTTGTSLEEILRQLLVHFQPPIMTLGGWTTSTYEHGAAYQDSAFTLSFSNFSNVDISDTGVASFNDTYIANGTNTTITAAETQSVSFFRSGTLLVDNGTPAGLSGTATQRFNAARLTVNGFTDTQGTGITGTSIGSTVRYRYWVLSSTTRIDFGDLNTTNGTALITTSSSLEGSGSDTIESNLLSSIGNLSINSAGTYDYVYWIYPTAWTVNNINNPLGLPIYTGDTTGSTTAAINYIGTFTLTNQHSADVSMTVLRTKNSGALGSGTYTVS